MDRFTHLRSAAIIPSIIVAVLTAAAPSARAIENDPTGFGGIVWGTSPESLGPEFERAETLGDVSYYRRNGEKMTLGEANVATILYRFWRGKFVSVSIDTRGERDGKALLDAARGLFGEPDRTVSTTGASIWRGHVGAVSYRCRGDGQCFLVIFSEPYAREQVEERRQQKDKRKGDF